MTGRHRRHSSFVIRIWWEQTGAAGNLGLIWRAWIQHAGSGQEAHVHNLKDLLAFMERRAGKLSGTSSGGLR